MERDCLVVIWGLGIIFFIVMLPISVISFAITMKVMFALLGIGLMLALVGYIVLLPATTLASLTGRQDHLRFILGLAGVVALLIVAGLTWFSLDQRAKSDAVHERLISEVRAGDQLLCDHPDSSLSSPMYFPTDDLYRTVQLHGWTCWTGGDEVMHPSGEKPFIEHFEFPYD